MYLVCKARGVSSIVIILRAHARSSNIRPKYNAWLLKEAVYNQISHAAKNMLTLEFDRA